MQHTTNQNTHMASDFKKRFFISTLATIPVLLLSPMIQSIFAFTLVFPASTTVLIALSSFIYGYGGWPFLKGCVLELKKKKMGMMTLVAVAITTAHSYSLLVAFKIVAGKTFFWEVTTLIDIMLLGHWIEMRSVMGASKAVDKLARLLPSNVNLLLPDGSIKTIKHAELKLNDKVLIKPGEKIPADGKITEGHADVNQAMLTGESRPIFKTKGDKVIGGSINQNGSLVVSVHSIGKDSYLAKIIDLVKTANASKSKAATTADKAAFVLTIIALITGSGTLGYWLLNAYPIHFALERMVTVMVITCPHALGLAIPLVISGITSLAAKHGLLIRNRTAFENARKCTTVVFDKTGTLTTGKFGVTQIIPCADWSKEKILKSAAAIERRSEHSIAKAIVIKAKNNNLVIPQIANFKAIPGLGAKGFVEGEDLFVGSPEIISEHASNPTVAKIFKPNFVIQQITDTQNKIQNLINQGKTVIVVTTKNEIKGIITLSDIVRQESSQACKELKKYKFELAMITGDNEKVANNVAEQLGIAHVFAKILPEEKTNIIKKLQEEGKKVIMVGDGINDAPALAQANVGIAIGSGTSIAAETSDIILVQNDPRDVVNVIKLSRTMSKKTFQNLTWATGYNVIAIPIAAGALYTYGVLLPPAIGTLIMTLSTLIVALNSKRLKIK